MPLEFSPRGDTEIVSNPPKGRDMAFRIAGLENPTLEVSNGARVMVRCVNGDSDSAHGWMLLDPVVQAGGTGRAGKRYRPRGPQPSRALQPRSWAIPRPPASRPRGDGHAGGLQDNGMKPPRCRERFLTSR